MRATVTIVGIVLILLLVILVIGPAIERGVAELLAPGFDR